MYNPYYNLHGNNFAMHPTIPPPPQPPRFFIPPNPALCQELNDKEFIKSFESRLLPAPPKPVKQKIQISHVFDQLRSIVVEINELKNRNKILTESMTSIPDDEWKDRMKDIEENKVKIKNMLEHIRNVNIIDVRAQLAKRKARRLPLKRVQMEKKMEREEKLKEMQEQSRKFDEQMQKIKEKIIKIKQEEEAKIQADIILKEVLRKKHDAKKCITKLDAFIKLRKARLNTRKGRGESVSESEAKAFNSNIEKLKSLWSQKLVIYEKEESELRKQLEQDSEDKIISGKEMDNKVLKILEQWRLALFGGNLPQVDFKGDITKFVSVRSQWDQFIHPEGTPLPVGWVPPTLKSEENDS